jgi:hypothetical protein
MVGLDINTTSKRWRLCVHAQLLANTGKRPVSE